MARPVWWLAMVLVLTGEAAPTVAADVEADPVTVWGWIQEARAALHEERWGVAARLLEKVTTLHSEDGRLWLELARAREGQGEWKDSLEPLRRARDLGVLEPGSGALRLAATYARLGRIDEALDGLETAFAVGYRFRESALGDDVFATLREHPRFAKLVGAAEPFESREDGWRADLGFLMAEIERVHYRFRDRPLPSSFREEARRLEREIPSLQDGTIVVRLQRLLASLGDGHSLLWPFGMRRGQLQRYPVGLWWFPSGLHFIRTGDDQTELLGARVVAIGGVPSAEVFDRLRPWVSHDNEWGFRWVTPVYLTMLEFLEAAGVSSPASRRWTVIDQTGMRAEVELTPVPVDPGEIPLSLIPPASVVIEDAPLYLRRLGEPFWWQPLRNGRVLYVQCNQLSDGADRSLADSARELRTILGKGEVEALVLDLRHNSGGDAGLLPELVRTLVHFETSSADSRLYVIQSRTTFSAAQTLVNLTEQLTGAVFVGEPGGTRPNRLGNEAPLRLPYSGVRGTLSSGYNQGASSRDHRLWIVPDLPTPLTAEAYFAGLDPALVAILTLEERH